MNFGQLKHLSQSNNAQNLKIKNIIIIEIFLPYYA